MSGIADVRIARDAWGEAWILPAGTYRILKTGGNYVVSQDDGRTAVTKAPTLREARMFIASYLADMLPPDL